MGYYQVPAERWMSFLDIAPDDVPETLVIQGAIDYPACIERGSRFLENTRPGWMPNLVVGRHGDRTVAFGVCFGGPIASQLTHIYCKVGTRRVVLIGTCGGLREDIELGDVVVPDGVLSLDGSARLYGCEGDLVALDPDLIAKAVKELEGRGARVHRGSSVSYYDILLERGEDLADLSGSGYVAVEMEAAAVGAVAQHFGTPAACMLVVADNSMSGKDLFYRQTEEERARVRERLDLAFEVALSL